ncbi:MAG: class I SAM-dependent methyltransferase [bacterium]|nr:class I SAM-dependent methyltransferase [bacterium]
MEVEFTGERFVPSLRGQIYYEHLHRYAVAGRHAAGKRILDVGSGEGYGAALLAQSARFVTGIDSNGEIVAGARIRYARENLDFVAADATNLPFDDATFDMVTCFETLEHLANQTELVAELHRVLSPGGMLLISSPNKAVYTDRHGNQNPFHVKELYLDELHALLDRHFPRVEIFGQRMLVTSALHALDAPAGAQAFWLNGDPHGVSEGLPPLEEPVYFLAVAGSGELPDLSSGFVDVDNDLFTTSLAHIEQSTRHTDTVRIMVASAPKSASTFVASVLARYFEAQIAAPHLHEMQWEAEQNLNRSLLTQLSGSYVLQMHMKPYPLNRRLMKDFDIALLLQWRNLGDMIVSLNDHLEQYGPEQPLFHVHDPPGFFALPAERRYDYVIRHACAWYVWFYLAWRQRGETFGVYERLVEDEQSFFLTAIERLGYSPDAERLQRILAQPEGFTRRNVGRVGRSAELFSEENKRLLERQILDNPWSEQLEILLWELPWDVPALAPRCAFDGDLIALAGSAERFFVSRGRRHRLVDSASWIASRAFLRDDSVRFVSTTEMDDIPEGAPLS